MTREAPFGALNTALERAASEQVLAKRLECIQLTLQAIERLLEQGVELMKHRESREDEMFEWRLEARRRSIQ